MRVKHADSCVYPLSVMIMNACADTLSAKACVFSYIGLNRSAVHGYFCTFATTNLSISAQCKSALDYKLRHKRYNYEGCRSQRMLCSGAAVAPLPAYAAQPLSASRQGQGSQPTLSERETHHDLRDIAYSFFHGVGGEVNVSSKLLHRLMEIIPPHRGAVDACVRRVSSSMCASMSRRGRRRAEKRRNYWRDVPGRSEGGTTHP